MREPKAPDEKTMVNVAAADLGERLPGVWRPGVVDRPRPVER